MPDDRNGPREPTHALYRFYDASGALLYIGITCNPGGRFERHRETKMWWRNVARIEMEQYPDRPTLAAAEKAAIQAEHPQHNIVHANGGKTATTSAVPGKRTDRLSVADATEFDAQSLVGSFFHSDAKRGWQGCIVAEVSSGVYLIELFDWLIGASSAQRLARLDDMIETGWQFYDTAEWMINTYERGGLAKRWEREHEEAEQTP